MYTYTHIHAQSIFRSITCATMLVVLLLGVVRVHLVGHQVDLQGRCHLNKFSDEVFLKRVDRWRRESVRGMEDVRLKPPFPPPHTDTPSTSIHITHMHVRTSNPEPGRAASKAHRQPPIPA